MTEKTCCPCRWKISYELWREHVFVAEWLHETPHIATFSSQNLAPQSLWRLYELTGIDLWSYVVPKPHGSNFGSSGVGRLLPKSSNILGTPLGTVSTDGFIRKLGSCERRSKAISDTLYLHLSLSAERLHQTILCSNLILIAAENLVGFKSGSYVMSSQEAALLSRKCTKDCFLLCERSICGKREYIQIPNTELFFPHRESALVFLHVCRVKT